MGYGPGWGRLVRARELMFSHFASASMQVRTPANSPTGMPLNVDASDECSTRHFEVATTQMR